MQTEVDHAADQPGAVAGNERAGREVAKPRVGYKQPPAQHRFQKGCSGNPNGRPRKRAAEATNDGAKTVEDVLLEEGQRLVSIREGDKVIKLSALQATIRGLGVAAMKGDRRAQLAFKQIVETAETRKQDRDRATFKAMLNCKDMCKAEIERCKARGLEPPVLLPHPDDIKLDFRTGEIKFVGPVDERQKHLWDEVQVEKDKLLGELVHLDDALHRFPRRKYIKKNYDYLEQLYLQISYYVPDEEDRRLPSYNREDRRPISRQQLARLYDDLKKSLG